MVWISRNTEVLPVSQKRLLLKSGSVIRIFRTASGTRRRSSWRALAGSFDLGPYDFDAAPPGIDRDRLGLGLHRAYILAVDQNGEIPEVGAQFLHIGHLNLDRHVQRGKCEIGLAAFLVSSHLTELHRVLRTDRHDRDGATAVMVIQPSCRLGAHRKDEIELVFLRKLDRFVALRILQIEIDDRKLDLVLARLENLENFGDRDVIRRRRPRIEHHHAPGGTAPFGGLRPNRQTHRIARIAAEAPLRIEVSAVAKPLGERLLAAQRCSGRRTHQQTRNDGAGQHMPDCDALDHSAGSDLIIGIRVEKLPARKRMPKLAVATPIQVRM